jgi:GntR family transcriptional regulator, arabinose operon transcriptional repressor
MEKSLISETNVKSYRIATRLTQEIEQGRYSPGSMLPPERKLAEMYQVSQTTMRKCLDILSQKGQLIKHPQRGVIVPEQSRPKRSVKQIVFVAPSLNADTNCYARGLNAGIDHSQYTLGIYGSNSDLEKYQQIYENIVDLRPDGIVLMPITPEICPLDGHSIARSGIPCVILGGIQIPGLACDRVRTDPFDAGRKVGRFVVEHGGRKVGYIAPIPVSGSRVTLDGIRLELGVAGLELPEERVFVFDIPHGFGSSPNPWIDARDRTAQLLKQGLNCDVIICGHDYPAIGVLKAVLEAGLRVPQDVQIISVQRCAVEELTPMKLTTIDRNTENQGRAAIELLLRRINGYDDLPEVHYIASDLIVGETTR